MKHPGLLNDILFKIVFGTQQSEPVLRALLNALLNLEGPRTIVNLEILNPGFDKEYLVEKGPILDVKAQDQAGRRYNIEVQLSPGLGEYISRSVYYTAKFFCDQINRGDSYETLRKTVSISILDFVLFPETQELHSSFTLWEPAQGRQLTDLLELHYIELRKFVPSKPHQLRTRFEKWLYLLKFADIYNSVDESLPDNLAQEEGIPMALDSMRKAYARDDIRELIEAREKAERDALSRLHTARKEGVDEGRLEGRRQIAQQMREEGYSLEQIQKLTGLSTDDI